MIVQTLGILLTFIEVGVGGGGVIGLREISSSGATSEFSENIHSRSICLKRKTHSISLSQKYKMAHIKVPGNLNS